MWQLTLQWQGCLGCGQGRLGACILIVPGAASCSSCSLLHTALGHCHKAHKHAHSIRLLSQWEHGCIPSQMMP